MSETTKDGPRAHILVVEDSSVFREMQTLLLGQAGFAVSAHENPHAALAAAGRQTFELVVIDYELPEMNGQDFMHALRKIQPDIAVVFVSGSLTIDLAIQLSSQGVAGIFNKPANPKTLLEKINETLTRHAVRDTAARAGSGSPLAPARKGNANSPHAAPILPSTPPAADQLAYTPRFVLGTSDPFREFTHRVWKVRDFRSVLLLQGEAGSPFELFGRELAEISIFRDGPLMLCEAAKFEPRHLIEVLAPSLLSHDAGTLVVFGVESFTAEQQKTLQDLTTGREIFLPFARRFRLILAATGQLSDRVDDGSFNETLFYKISSLSLAVPSLRELRGDIATNAARILAQLGEAQNSAPATLAPEAAEWIENQEWPGNYEQLAHTLQLALGNATGSELTVAALESSLYPENATDTSNASLPTSASVPLTEQQLVGETRPPFPLTGDLAVDTGAVAANSSRSPAPIGGLNAQSLFRPASSSYSFTQRLAETIEVAEACGAA